MKLQLIACALTALIGTAQADAAQIAAPVSTVTDAQFSSVLKGDWRLPQNSARDPYRHPQQTLQFFGLRANQTLIEITPGNGWYSELLAPLLKDKGHYIAAVQAATTSDYSRRSAESLKQKFDAEGDQAFPGHGCLPPLEEEVRRLRAENKRLQMERDILKKATAFFAAEAR